ncbi:MAG: hypothetical protein HY744_17635 [Deltaproteobacteria bacterium]|nr:hypothetical protein [Deltaproteobacteria bacterium]
MNLRHVGTFIGSALAAFIVATASVGSAASRRISAHDCHLVGSVSTQSEGWYITITNDSNNQQVFCPFLDEGGVFLKENATHANIYVYDNDTSGWAVASLCSGSTSGTSGGCGSSDDTDSGTPGNTGRYILQPAFTYWQGTYATNFGYAHIIAVSSNSSWNVRVLGWKPDTL